MKQKEIIIIGAGAAGIACATKLLAYNFQNVTILEAESRIGGRIHTIPFGDNVIDLGAQWCHGEKNNVVFELVEKFNLLKSSGDIQENYMLIRSNGDILAEKVTKRLLKIYDKLKHRRDNIKFTQAENAAMFYQQEFEKILKEPKYKTIDVTTAAEFLQNFEKFENSDEGADTLAELTAAGDAKYEKCKGNQLLNWHDKGYKEFLNVLMETEEHGRKFGTLEKIIKCNKRVIEINWCEPNGKVSIKCADNKVHQADHVIVTVSLGVLKTQHKLIFQPTLPPSKIAAIEALNFGTVNKMFMEFPAKFWPDNWLGFALLWIEQDLKQLRGTKRAWFEHVVGFFCVDHQPRVLLGWISGPYARHIESLEVAEVEDGCMEILNRFLPWQIPSPLNFKLTTWFSNAHFCGSYSYQSIKTETAGLGPQDLANPLLVADKLRLQFAGEATSTQHYSTVHGAVETGWREATRLAKFYDC